MTDLSEPIPDETSVWLGMSRVYLTAQELKIIQAIRTRQRDAELPAAFDLVRSFERWADGELTIMFQDVPKPFPPHQPLLSEGERRKVIEAHIRTALAKHDITIGKVNSISEELVNVFDELYSRPELRKK